MDDNAKAPSGIDRIKEKITIILMECNTSALISVAWLQFQLEMKSGYTISIEKLREILNDFVIDKKLVQEGGKYKKVED